MINNKHKSIEAHKENLLERSRKGDDTAMLELSMCCDSALSNMWLVRAVLYGNKEAREILQKNPECASDLFLPIKNFLPEIRNLWFTGSYSAESLKKAGFDELPDLHGSYIVAGLSNERVLIIGLETDEQPPDEDGFGMKTDYDYYVYDEFFHRISEKVFVDDPYSAYDFGIEYIKAHNDLPELRFDWFLEDGLLTPIELTRMKILSYSKSSVYSNVIDSFINILNESLKKELNERVIDHDYLKLFNFTEELTKKLSALTEQKITSKDFLESEGQTFLEQNDFEKAYVVFRACAENCNSSVAQYNLGNMFVNGQGVTSDSLPAYYWFYKAAKNNSEKGSLAGGNILCEVAKKDNPIFEPFKEDLDSTLPGFRNVMNIQVFIRTLVKLCENGCDVFPRDPDTATQLRKEWKNLLNYPSL